MNRHHFKYHTWRPYSCPQNYSAWAQSLFFVSSCYPDDLVCLIQKSSKFLISDMRLTMIDRPLKADSECPSLPGLWRMHSMQFHHPTVYSQFRGSSGRPVSISRSNAISFPCCLQTYIHILYTNGRTYLLPIAFDGFISILWQIRSYSFQNAKVISGFKWLNQSLISQTCVKILFL